MNIEDNSNEVFDALDRMIATTAGFVSVWGEPDPVMFERLERYVGRPLPADFRAFALRYGNVHVGYLPVQVLGPIRGVPAAEALTEDRRGEWPAFPLHCLALGEHNTDLIVLQDDGEVQFRTESSRDLVVFRRFPSFTAFLRHAIDWAVARAKWLERVPPSFSPWLPSAEQGDAADRDMRGHFFSRP